MTEEVRMEGLTLTVEDVARSVDSAGQYGN